MKLQEIFAPNEYSYSDVDKIIYARDASVFEGTCLGVVWPTTKEQVQQFVMYCRRTSHTLTIRGAGSSTYGGAVPMDAFVVDMSRMKKILDMGSDWVKVQAGVVLSDLNRFLRRKNKCFPIQPLEYPVCTIGGMIATNTSGMNVYDGRMEDWVLELEVVDGAGRTYTVSSTKMKDFIGTEGTTGIIVAAKLKILQQPVEKTASIATFNTISSMMSRIEQIEKNPHLLCITYFDERTSALLDLGPALHIIVEYADDSGMVKDKEEIKKIDELKEKVQHLLVNAHYNIREDPKVPLENRGKFLHWLDKQGIVCYGHMKHGIFYLHFREPSNQPEEIYTLVEKLSGEIIGDFPVGMKRKNFLRKEKKERLLMLKNQYDSQKILNRGVLID